MHLCQTKVNSIAQVCGPSTCIPDPVHQSPHPHVPVPPPESPLSPLSPLNPVSNPISSNSNSNSHSAITLANPLSYPIESSSCNLSNPSSGHPQPKSLCLPFLQVLNLLFYPIPLAHPANPHHYNILLFLLLFFLILPLVFLLLSPYILLTLLPSNHSILLHPPLTLHIMFNIPPTL